MPKSLHRIPVGSSLSRFNVMGPVMGFNNHGTLSGKKEEISHPSLRIYVIVSIKIDSKYIKRRCGGCRQLWTGVGTGTGTGEGHEYVSVLVCICM